MGGYGIQGGQFVNLPTSLGGLGCDVGLAQDPTEATRAGTNELNYGIGMGTSMLYLTGGPGADPTFNPSTYTSSDATAWGEHQADEAVDDWYELHDADPGYGMNGYIYADIEYYMNNDDGWTSKVSNCDIESGASFSNNSNAATWSRAVFDGFTNVLSDYGFDYGVYSSSGEWGKIFHCGSSCNSGTKGYIPYTFEWTYSNLNDVDLSATDGPDDGWCVNGSSCTNRALFFGGQIWNTSIFVAAWQWDANYDFNGDYDQLDETNLAFQ